MASAIIHISVAKKVNEYLNLREKELFLGAIAPDISKQINETKIKSHFQSTIEDVPDIDLFLHKYKSKIKTPFDYGYLIHLYTDKIWYLNLEDMIGLKGKKLLNSDEVKSNKELIRNLYYNDYTSMNVDLIDEYNLDLTLFYEEFEIPDTCINEIPIEKLNILIDKMGTIIVNSKNQNNKVFDYQKVVNFINKVSDEIIDFLKSNSL